VPRRALVAVAGVALALVAGFFLIRDSSLVAVDEVTVTGTSGPDAEKVRSALTAAAGEMTTLNVRMDQLEAAVDEYPIVGRLEVRRDLPNKLTVEVVQRRPVALASIGGREIPVTGDGRLLHGATPPRGLPKLALERTPTRRVDDRDGSQLVAVAAAAPGPLLHRTRRVFLGDRGVTLELTDGPELYFGSDDDARAKWVAVARVLADPSAEGAQYVDVREPSRPAAGGLTPLVAADETSTTEAPVITPETVTPGSTP
jgi:cell division protein FtsQ